MGFLEQVRTSCGPQSLSKHRMPGLGVCVVPRGPQRHPSAGPWGASYRRGVTKDTRQHLDKGQGLDLVDDGTRWRGRRGSTLWVFWNKSLVVEGGGTSLCNFANLRDHCLCGDLYMRKDKDNRRRGKRCQTGGREILFKATAVDEVDTKRHRGTPA